MTFWKENCVRLFSPDYKLQVGPQKPWLNSKGTFQDSKLMCVRLPSRKQGMFRKQEDILVGKETWSRRIVGMFGERFSINTT